MYSLHTSPRIICGSAGILLTASGIRYGQGRNKNVNWGAGVFIHLFMFCPADFFSN